MKTPFFSFLRRCMNRTSDKCFGVISAKSFVELVEEQAPYMLRLFSFKSEEDGCINTISHDSRTHTFTHYPPVEETGYLIGGITWSGLFVDGDAPETLIQQCMCRVVYDFERIDFDGGFMLVPKLLAEQEAASEIAPIFFERLHSCGKLPQQCECFVQMCEIHGHHLGKQCPQCEKDTRPAV